jgi:hypothetical protein
MAFLASDNNARAEKPDARHDAHAALLGVGRRVDHRTAKAEPRHTRPSVRTPVSLPCRSRLSPRRTPTRVAVAIVVDDDMACVESPAQYELKRFIHREAAKNFAPASDTSLGVERVKVIPYIGVDKRVSELDGHSLSNRDNEDHQLPSTAKPTIGPPSPDEDCSIWDGCQSPVPIPLPRPRP